jgi:Thioredoxin-like
MTKKMSVWMVLAVTMLSSMGHAADLGYDPQADPFDQYAEAVAKAGDANKLVLIIAGGDWCRWCHVLNRFVANNDEVEQRLNDTFVVMKVYVGPGNYNEPFFSQLPQAYGAPHFWIVSPKDREVLASQSTAKLERGTSTYDKSLFLAFIESWQQTLTESHRQALLSE